MLKLSLKIILALLAALVLAAAFYVWRSFPTLDGELRAPGLAAPVLVRRDAADVTHIEAKSITDAYFALGYVHAQERGWQLEFNRRVMRGELSEVLGAATLDTDRLLRTLGIMSAAQAQWERLPPDAKAMLQAYANGINSFHAHSSQALPPEFHILRVKPGTWTPQDSVGWSLMMALDLGGNWGNEFARLSVLQRLNTAELWQLMPPYPGEAPTTRVDLARLYRDLGVYASAPANGTRTSVAPAAGPWATAMAHDIQDWAANIGNVEGKGSNNWVVDGSHTQSGKPLLANDPHLGLSAPAIWYFARIKAPAAPGGKPMDVMGATLPGLPTVVLGRTAGVAWGFTNTSPDVQDLYLEQINPGDAQQYRTPGGWARFGVREEIIRVKGMPDQKLVVRSTRHGPVLSDAQAVSHGKVINLNKYVLALRWSALDADNQTVLAGYNANFAQNADELRAAYAIYHSPMQNLVVADTRGRVAYQAIGRVPLRHKDDDLRGIAPAPGWEARYDWAGWLPAHQTPRQEHEAIAARGWHATANQRIHEASYPHFIGADWHVPDRQQRIETLLAANPKHDAASMREIQADIVSLATQRLLPLLRDTSSQHALAATVKARLQVFDGRMAADSTAALVFAVWADELTRGLIGPKIGEERFKALYGKRHFRAGVELMLLDPKVGAWWCAPLSCVEQSTRALDRALDRLAALYGNDVGAWQWGRAHPALSVHRPFGNVAALARFYDVAVPTGGDSWTVNVGQYWPNDLKTPFANRHAASLRAIYDLSDLEKSQFIYQTGQSGLVFSARYRDMAAAWAQVQYRPLQLQPAQWAHESTLKP